MPRPSSPLSPDIDSRRRPAGRRSFTLVEMLVSCVIFVFMMLVLMGLVSQSSRIWQQTNGQRSSRESARILLEMIGRDLESAVFPVNSTNQTLVFQLNPTVSGGNYLNPTAAFWQASLPGTGGTNGDVEDVGYFVNWVTIGKQAHGTLCRFVIPAADPNSIFSDPDRDWTESLFNTYAPGLNSTSPGSANAYKGLLADNVLGLWITLYATNMEVIGAATLPYDSRLSSSRPAYADVTLVMLDPVLAQRITSAGTITNHYAAAGATNTAAFVTNLPSAYAAGAEIFTTRVQIQSAQ